MILRAVALAFGVLAAQPAAAPRPPRAEVTLDQAVAALETEGDTAPRFVLRSDFVLLLRTELLMHGAPDALHAVVDPVTVSGPILEQLGAEVLVVREAERAAMGDADPSDVASHRDDVLRRIGGEEGVRQLLEATGASAGEFDALLRRRAIAERYLAARYPRLIEPTVEELRERYDRDHRDATQASESFAAVRPALFARMVRDALPRALRQYLRSLGSRVRVRRLGATADAP